MAAANNNKFPDCPALMSDGRGFTDYRPRCLSQAGGVCAGKGVSAFDLRMYLTRNGESIMEAERREVMRRMGCGQGCRAQVVALPEQNMQGCDKRTCYFGTHEVDGLGTGRDYFRSRNAPSYFAPETPAAPAAVGGHAAPAHCVSHEDMSATAQYIQGGRY